MANSIPTLTGLATPVTFLENTVNAAPQIIDADVTFTDADNNFNGGALTVTGLLAEDSVAIRNQGTGAGQIGVSGGNVTFGGTVIGSFTGGAGSTLSVTFNASATAGGIEALIENLTYANSSDTPTASRSLELKVSDAAGFAAIAPITFAQQTGAANPFNGLTISTGVHRVAFGDLDGDGDLDAVVGENDGRLFYYLENTGSAIAPAFTARFGAANPFNGIDVGSQAAPAVADLDGDGDLDAVVGELYGTLHYFKNTGTAAAPTFAEQTGAANPFNGVDVGFASAPSFGDLDGDGDLDAVVGESGGTLRFFENTGTAIAPAFTERTGAANPFNGIDVGSRSSPGFADLDGDGDLDVLVGTLAATLHYVENTGTAIAPAFTVRTGAANPFNDISAAQDSEVTLQATTPTFGDLDGDGDLDAVQGSNQNALRYFLNTTPHQPTQHFDQQTGAANPFSGVDVGLNTTPSFADLDGDGDLDVLVGATDGTLRYLENTGTAVAPAFTARTGAANPFNGVDVGDFSTLSLADLDGDGDLDAVVGESVGNLNYFENTGTAVAPAFTARTGAANPFNGVNVGSRGTPSFADLDGDGDLDAVVGENDGILNYFENTGSAIAPAFTQQTGAANPFNGVDVGTNSAPSFADLDDDDDLDAVVGGGNGTLNYFENTGSAIAPAFTARTGAANPFNGVDVGNYSTPSFSDLDDDGDLDAVVGDGDGNLNYFRNTGAGFVQVVNVTAENDAPAITLDGDLDAVVANLFGNNVSVLIGNGAGGFTSAPVGGVGPNPDAVALGDVDGDGDLDALVANFNSTNVSVLLGDGAGGFTAAAPVGVGIQPYSVALGDVDGDGDLDALVANYSSNTVSVLLGNGAGGFSATTVGVGTRPGSVALGDVNGDGRLDALVANASDNNVSVLLGDGAGGFTTATPVGVGTLPRSVALGDVDGDGHLDALVANSSGSGNVSVLLGNGAGGFTAATTVGVGINPYSVALGDVDGDGDLDALVANASSGNVSVLLGNGAGGFTAATPVGVGTFPFSVALGDVNGDGHLDALVANRGSNDVSVLLGNGAGGFTAAATVGAGNGPRSVAIGDVNNAQITDEDTPFVFSAANGNALTLSDDAGNDETLTLAAQHGKLTLATLAGLSGVSGNGTHTVAFTGTVAEINAALNGLSYAPDQDFNGRDTLAVTANDNASAAVGGPLTATKLVPITVTSVDDAPLIISASAVTAAENVSTAAVVYDAAAQDPEGDSVTFSLSAGGDNDLFKIDATTGEITFKTSPNYEAPGDFGGNNVYDIVVRASDGVLTTTKAVVITVTDVNAPPVITSGATATVAENVATSAVVYLAVALDDGEDSGLAFSLSPGGDNDLFDIDATTGAITFKASPNYEAPGDFGGNNVYDIVVRVSDGGLSATKAVAITVTNANEAPEIFSGPTATVVENVSTGAVVYDAAAQDGEGDSVIFSLSAGGDNDLFKIDATTGEVTFKVPPNYEAPGDAGGNNVYDIVVRASDGVLASTRAVSITVTDVNASPVITSASTATVAENVSTSTVVYAAAAQDDGEDSGSLTYSLSAGGDRDLFDIDATTGEVTFKVSPDYEAPGDFGGNNVYDIVVRASDGLLSDTRAVAITVTNVNAAPVITSGATGTAAENASTSTVVYDAAAQDDGEDSGGMIFSLSAGGDNDLFDIDATTGEVTFKVSPNYEAPGDAGGNNVYDIVVHASDGVQATAKAVAITVTNANAAPVITSGATATVAENVSTSAVVYAAAAVDDGEDSGGVTFSLSAGGDNDLFRIDAATGEVTFKVSPDYEAPGDAGGNNVYDIVVRASDGVLATTRAVAITVTDVNAAPVIVSTAAVNVAENVSISAVAYDAAAVDDGEGGGVTFSLSAGGDNDLFNIDATTGEVTFKTSPNYEAPGDFGGNNVYDIVVRASDGLLSSTKAVAITVTNVNAAPVITSGATATVAENVSTSEVVYAAAAQDDGEDSGSMFFSLSAGGDNDLFKIDAATGEVTFKVPPNYEAPGDADGDNVYDIVVHAIDGVLATTRAVSITVTNVNAAPVITSGATATVAENVATSTEVYRASVMDDGESGSAVTFSLGGEVDDSRFTIDLMTGAVTFKVSPDYEAPADSGADNVYDIVVQASDGLLSATIRPVRITVTNVNAAPVFVSGATATVSENVSTSTQVYKASVMDDGESGSAVTFSLGGGVDDNRFAIDPTSGAVTFKAPPDYESPTDAGADNVYDIVVQASDGLLSAMRSVRITVTNVNAAPVFVSGATATVAENVSTSTVVYKASVTDDGESGSSVTFSLGGGVDDNRFAIDPTSGAVTFKASPNYEAPSDGGADNGYDIVVQASDGLLSAVRSVRITVTNVNAAPVITSGATATVAENVSTSTVVYKASVADDGENGSAITFSLGGGVDDNRFAIDPTTGAVTFKASPNYEAPSDSGADNAYDIVVQASDGLSATIRSVRITVTNVNAAPVIVSGATATVAENVSTSIEVYKASATDDGESGSAVTFSLGGGVDDNRFAIDPTTGTVTFKASPDYEAPTDAGADNAYDIVVQASDGVLATTKAVRITVTNVNAAPVFVSGATATVAENVSTSTEVYKASATDDGESGSAATFALGGGVDDNRFAIDPTTGAVTFKVSPDYEAPADAGADNAYDIVVHASDGVLSAAKAVRITVTNVNAAPVIVSGATATVSENVSTSTQVYKASVMDDGESGSAVTFSLGGGVDDNRFAIDPTSGAVTFKAPPNYESPTDAGADNVYDIVVQASDGLSAAMRSVSITVSNVTEAANAVEDAYVLIRGSTLVAGPNGTLLLNDDVSGLVPIVLVDGPDNGTLQLAADGAFSYAPDAGFSGVDRFEYGIVDGAGIGHVAEARIYVTPVKVDATTTLDLLALTAREQVAATYVAVLGRAADAGGFKFWIDEFDGGLRAQGPATLFANIASSFGRSDEAKALYPFLANPFGAGAGSIADFIESVYDNLFNRSPDAAGLTYWIGQVQQTLASGRFVGSVLVDIISGAQDTAAGRDITTLMSKVAVSLAFVGEQQEHRMQWSGASDVAAARQLLDPVSSDQASVLTGIKNAAGLVESHP